MARRVLHGWKKGRDVNGRPRSFPQKATQRKGCGPGNRRGEKSNIWLKKKLETRGIAPKPEVGAAVSGAVRPRHAPSPASPAQHPLLGTGLGLHLRVLVPGVGAGEATASPGLKYEKKTANSSRQAGFPDHKLPQHRGKRLWSNLFFPLFAQNPSLHMAKAWLSVC